MKPPQEWEEPDLADLITNKIEEGPQLDYKGADSLGMNEGKKHEVGKDVSAFANAEGGVIIYGMEETGHLPTAIDPVDQTQFTKEWLEHVINSRIQRRIEGVSINPIRLTGANAGSSVYAVVIPQSQSAPHMANTRYYKRFNFESVPMEDYEVRDVVNRRRHPIVKARLSVGVPDWDANANNVMETSISLKLANEGKVIAQRIYIELTYLLETNSSRTRLFGQQETFKVDQLEFARFKYHLREAGGPLPLFPGTEHDVFTGEQALWLRLQRGALRFYGHVSMDCRVYADDAPVAESSWNLAELCRAQLIY